MKEPLYDALAVKSQRSENLSAVEYNMLNARTRQKARKPESQKARKPESQKARKPESQKARKPESQKARKPEETG